MTRYDAWKLGTPPRFEDAKEAVCEACGEPVEDGHLLCADCAADLTPADDDDPND